jgi:hypothetical protein
MNVTIGYKTKRGVHTLHTLPCAELPDALRRLWRRRIEAIAWVADKPDYLAGKVWKVNGRWNWFADPDGTSSRSLMKEN